MKKKIAVWGTGTGAFKISAFLEKIDFYIENNEQRVQKNFLGKSVLLAENIHDWNDIYIYIYPKFYNEISSQLKEIRLKENEDFEQFDIKRFNSINDINEIQNSIEVFFDTLLRKKDLKDSIVIFSPHIGSANRDEYNKWFRELFTSMQKEHFFFLSEALFFDEKYIKESIGCETQGMPLFWCCNCYIKQNSDKKLEIIKDIEILLEQHSYLTEIAQCIRLQYPDMIVNYELYYVFYVYQITVELINRISPKKVILWSTMSPTHTIIQYVCKTKNIKVYALHEGMLYHTFYLDSMGEHGESVIVKKRKKIKELDIKEKDYEFTQTVLEKLYFSKGNRHIQPQNYNDSLLKKLKKDRPVITFLGDADHEMFLLGNGKRVQKGYSPIFHNGIDEACFLAEVVEQKDWNFIYKPHPGIGTYAKEQIPENVRSKMFFVDSMNIHDLIDLSSVVVVNISSCGYEALLRDKPVVSTGYNTYYGYGCVYQATTRMDVSEVLCEAVKYGFTNEMKKSYLFHMAILLKYYLYKGGIGMEYWYGKELPRDTEDIEYLENL